MSEKKTIENGSSKTTAKNKAGGTSKAGPNKQNIPLFRSSSKASGKTVAAKRVSAPKKSAGTKSRQKKTVAATKQNRLMSAILGIFIGSGLTLVVLALVMVFSHATEKNRLSKKTGASTFAKSNEQYLEQPANVNFDEILLAEENSAEKTSDIDVRKDNSETTTQNKPLAKKIMPKECSSGQNGQNIKENTATEAERNSNQDNSETQRSLFANSSNSLADVQVASGKKDSVNQQASALAATIPQAAAGTKLVFVFDDGGQNMGQLEHFVTLPFPVTIAVLPRLAHSAEAASRIRSSGNEVILHQPMQALNLNINPGAGAILPNMSAEEIVSIMKENLAEIGPVSGMNNHEGSLISEDEFKMASVLATAKENGIFYLDSRTTSQSRVAQAALEVGIGYYERNVFLDNTKKRDDILREIRRGIDIANKKGSAIMIGHIWSADILPAILRELHPILISKGYSFSTVGSSGAMVN